MKYEEIQPLLENLTAIGVEWSLGLSHRGVGNLWITNVSQTSENYRAAMAALVSFYGRLDKDISSGIQSWRAVKDGQSLTMYRVAQCKVTGYRTVERPKVVEVETEEIETVEEPIYDCSEVE